MQFTPGCKFIVDVEPLKHDLLQENRVCFSISRTPLPSPILVGFGLVKLKEIIPPFLGSQEGLSYLEIVSVQKQK